MPSSACERAIDDALSAGNAILKFISPNDAGLTGTHQCGFYLPKSVWSMYTPHPPIKGRNDKHFVSILWPDGRTTRSAVTWYGKLTRSEYRLTRFGRDFPWLVSDMVGNLLVLIPRTQDAFIAHILDTEEDIQEIQAALGVEPFEDWGVFVGGKPRLETEDECLERKFCQFADSLEKFPTGDEFSEAARNALQECVRDFSNFPVDQTLMRCYESEYRLFQIAERRLCQDDINRLFKDLDEFIHTAARIMNRRKARAGRSLENHVDYLLTANGIPHQMRPSNIEGVPDIVIPSSDAYHDASYPRDKLFIVAVKTTCKDRWRQVTREGRRVAEKHILTLQQGISTSQLKEMDNANVKLIVPEVLHAKYKPPDGMKLLTVQNFFTGIKRQLEL
jgi:hypothetical protein